MKAAGIHEYGGLETELFMVIIHNGFTTRRTR